MNDSNEKMTFVVSTTYASRHLPRMSTNASDHVTAVVRQKTSTAENTNSTHRRTARGKRRGACLAGDRSSNSVKKRRGNTNCTAKQKKCSSLAQDTGRRNISRGSNDIILESRKDAFRPGNTFFRLLCWKARPAYFNAKKYVCNYVQEK